MSSNNNNDVYTAVSLGNSDGSDQKQLDEPLLGRKTQGADVSALNASFRWHGFVIGCLAQIVNVTGTTYMFYQWDSPNGTGVIESSEILDQLVHGLVWLVTQTDLYLYLFMWVCLTAVLTRSGMEYVRKTYFGRDNLPSKRSVFVLGVQFYVGVVVGVFFAWTGIDCMLGLPVPVMPMIGVLVFGLCISYTMVWCYDMEEEEEDEDEVLDVILEVEEEA